HSDRQALHEPLAGELRWHGKPGDYLGEFPRRIAQVVAGRDAASIYIGWRWKSAALCAVDGYRSDGKAHEPGVCARQYCVVAGWQAHRVHIVCGQSEAESCGDADSAGRSEVGGRSADL